MRSSSFYRALCLWTFVGLVVMAPIESDTENNPDGTQEAMMFFFNRPPPTFKIFSVGGVTSCLQACIQPGKSASEIHTCSRNCLASSGTN